ncbi:hypothetical protein [Microbulbifer sp. ZKSA002]|uniref:hypothetical protein n=1 Tax=Microbulbifer sp. ZKSA002 TaxID=3243388 RepID=UPI004039BC2B
MAYLDCFWRRHTFCAYVFWAAALAAAENRSLVALWTFLVGALLALFLGLVTNYVFPALLAIIAGGFAYWVVDKVCEKANR